MVAGKRKKLCRGLLVCLKFSLMILKHRNDDEDKKKKTTTAAAVATFCGTPLHIQIFCQKA
jgi:hypothetical protein